MNYDRDEILRRVPLDELCDDLLGSRKGKGSVASWRCPSPNHGPQSGRTPPVTLFRSRTDENRWHCHGCGAGGTAFDIVMVSQQLQFREALKLLARRAGLRATTGDSRSLRPATPRPIRPLPAAPPHAVVEDYVATCEALLASPSGADVRNWLLRRGFGTSILVANRVGADPGPERLARARGLPRGGRGAVFPVLQDDRVVYAQVRYIDPGEHRWANPSARLAPSPHLASVCLAGAARRPDLLLITEGMTDALTAGEAGYQAVALLGVSLVESTMATTLVERWPNQQLVVAFDAGNAGRRGSARLISLLGEAGVVRRPRALELPRGVDDLNEWRQATGHSFRAQLDDAIGRICPVERGRQSRQLHGRAATTPWVEPPTGDHPLGRSPRSIGGDGIGL